MIEHLPQTPLDDDPIANLSAAKALHLEEAIAHLGGKKGGNNPIASLFGLAFLGGFGLEKKRTVIRSLYEAMQPLAHLLAEAGVPLQATKRRQDTLLVCAACKRGFESADEYLNMVQDVSGRPYHRVCLAVERREADTKV